MRVIGRFRPEWGAAPSMITAEAASSRAWSISTVALSTGAAVRLGNQAGSRIATQPAEMRIIRIRMLRQEGREGWVGGRSGIDAA